MSDDSKLSAPNPGPASCALRDNGFFWPAVHVTGVEKDWQRAVATTDVRGAMTLPHRARIPHMLPG